MNATFVLHGESMLPLTTRWLDASLPLYATIVGLNDNETPAPLQSAQDCANELFCLAVHRGAPIEVLQELTSVRFDNMAVDVRAHARTRDLRPRSPLQIAAQQSHAHALEFLITRCESIVVVGADAIESALESQVSADAVRRCLTVLFASEKLAESARRLQSSYVFNLLNNQVIWDCETLQLLFDSTLPEPSAAAALLDRRCCGLLGANLQLSTAFLELYVNTTLARDRELALRSHFVPAISEAIRFENLRFIRVVLENDDLSIVEIKNYFWQALVTKRESVVDLMFEAVQRHAKELTPVMNWQQEGLVAAFEIGRVNVARFCIEAAKEETNRWATSSVFTKRLLVAAAPNAEAIDLLIDTLGKHINRISAARALCVVARAGNVRGLERLVTLIEQGTDGTIIEDKCNAMMDAVAYNKTECARLLMNMGARLSTSHWYVITKLAERDNVELLELALSKEKSVPPAVMSTALELAGEFGATRAAQLLMGRGVQLGLAHYVACARANRTNMLQLFDSARPITSEWRDAACRAAMERRSLRAALWLRWTHMLDVLIAWHTFELPIHVQLQILQLTPEFDGIVTEKQLPTIARVRAFQTSK
jgi:hypothetical protein